MNKFLICGLGSIGQRHVRLLKKITNDTAQIAALRLRKRKITISDSLKVTPDVPPEKHYRIQTFDNQYDAFNWKPDCVFVTNPISMHIETALLAARARAHVFIEKPLGSSKSFLQELTDVLSHNKLTCMVGFQQRYHPAYRDLKKLIEDQTLGSVISADLHFGEWLPGMHPYEDYRDSHAARLSQGGGVINCLSHMFDIAYWLFGYPDRLFTVGGHISSLELDDDIEDVADTILLYTSDNHVTPVHIHLDFLQSPPRIYTHVVFDNGVAHLDFIANSLKVTQHDGSCAVKDYPTFQRNDMFVAEIQDFLGACKNSTKSPIPIEDGIRVLDMCLAAKKSLRTCAPVSLA